jgi:hypothetical protein
VQGKNTLAYFLPRSTAKKKNPVSYLDHCLKASFLNLFSLSFRFVVLFSSDKECLVFVQLIVNYSTIKLFRVFIITVGQRIYVLFSKHLRSKHLELIDRFGFKNISNFHTICLN